MAVYVSDILIIVRVYSVASLGASALNGMQLHARWKLWDPRVSYRPFALNQTFGFLNKELNRVTPDLWVAVLHKRLIGGGAALPVRSNNTGSVLSWTHCPRGVDSVAGVSFVLMFSNPLNFTADISVASTPGTESAAAEAIHEEFVRTGASKADGLMSTFASLNGGAPLALSENGEPPSLQGRRAAAGRRELSLPPFSYGFVAFSGPPLSACA